jgi:hypothetical protein
MEVWLRCVLDLLKRRVADYCVSVAVRPLSVESGVEVGFDLPDTGHSPTSASGPKRRLKNWSFRGQSGRRQTSIRGLKADI